MNLKRNQKGKLAFHGDVIKHVNKPVSKVRRVKPKAKASESHTVDMPDIGDIASCAGDPLRTNGVC